MRTAAQYAQVVRPTAHIRQSVVAQRVFLRYERRSVFYAARRFKDG